MKPLHTDMNAERWAEEFVELHGGDIDLMRSWFANAIMCGWDNHYWTTEEYKNSIDKILTPTHNPQNNTSKLQKC